MNTSLNTPRVGDILRASWGYDATWQDFYQVVAVTKTSVRVQELNVERRSSEAFDRVAVYPIPGSFKNEDVLTRKVHPGGRYSNSGYYVKIRSHSLAFLETDISAGHLESMYC